jgi:hypothetical protein
LRRSVGSGGGLGEGGCGGDDKKQAEEHWSRQEASHGR